MRGWFVEHLIQTKVSQESLTETARVNDAMILVTIWPKTELFYHGYLWTLQMSVVISFVCRHRDNSIATERAWVRLNTSMTKPQIGFTTFV
jgi:hypothetical protein